MNDNLETHNSILRETWRSSSGLVYTFVHTLFKSASAVVQKKAPTFIGSEHTFIRFNFF